MATTLCAGCGKRVDEADAHYWASPLKDAGANWDGTTTERQPYCDDCHEHRLTAGQTRPQRPTPQRRGATGADRPQRAGETGHGRRPTRRRGRR